METWIPGSSACALAGCNQCFSVCVRLDTGHKHRRHSASPVSKSGATWVISVLPFGVCFTYIDISATQVILLLLFKDFFKLNATKYVKVYATLSFQLEHKDTAIEFAVGVSK